MKSNPSVPDELIMFDRQFSWRAAWRVGRWWFVALVVSSACDVIFAESTRQWPLGVRVAVVGIEFLALGLFCRDAARWVHKMDELQRRIAVGLLLFSTSLSFAFFLLWLRLEREGLFDAILGPPISNGTWGISSVAHACVVLGGFYGLGFLVFKRRFK